MTQCFLDKNNVWPRSERILPYRSPKIIVSKESNFDRLILRIIRDFLSLRQGLTNVRTHRLHQRRLPESAKKADRTRTETVPVAAAEQQDAKLSKQKQDKNRKKTATKPSNNLVLK